MEIQAVWDSAEAARYLKIHPRTLTRMARRGQIPGFQIGKQWRFRLVDLDVWMALQVSCQSKLSLSASTKKGGAK